MSSTNSHQAAATTANAATTAAAVINNQTLSSSSSSSHQAANLIGFHRQQELIKLLTQHFHNQFYQQLANNSTSELQQRQQQQQYAPISHGRLAPAADLTAQYQQHYQAAQNLSAISSNIRTNDLNPFSQDHQQSQQHFLANHLLRSQHLDNNNSTTNAGSITGLVLPEACADFSPFHSNLPASAYQAAINGDNYNLFNALGLNLLNNQLVLSPRQQQQVLIQQQTLSTRDNIAENEDAAAPARPRHRQTVASSKESTRRVGGGQNNNSIYRHLEADNGSEQGKEFLKFSINTILATSSSPKSTSTILDESHLNEDNSLGAIKEAHKDNTEPIKHERNFANSNAHLDDSDAPDCDSIVDLESDSSSIGSSTPHASGTSCSILFDQAAGAAQQRTDNHSANFTSTGPMNASPKVNQNNNQRLLMQQQQQQQQPTGHPSLPPFLAGSTAFPWTVAARGKPRRGMMRRAVFSDSQRVGLEKRFQLQKYISKPDRKKLAEKLGLRDSQVKIWFQNRRMKWRNSKERELLSAGGSREQTLPTRNNPNPDLSDVGETIKRLASSNTNSVPLSSNAPATK